MAARRPTRRGPGRQGRRCPRPARRPRRRRRRLKGEESMNAVAKLRYMKGSAQKVRLVADLIRGKKVNDAAAILRATPKYACRDILKLLKSAIANAEQKEAGVDVDTLVVRKIHVDGGPREKRIRPA